jgi:hypothetical protein
LIVLGVGHARRLLEKFVRYNTERAHRLSTGMRPSAEPRRPMRTHRSWPSLISAGCTTATAGPPDRAPAAPSFRLLAVGATLAVWKEDSVPRVFLPVASTRRSGSINVRSARCDSCSTSRGDGDFGMHRPCAGTRASMVRASNCCSLGITWAADTPVRTLLGAGGSCLPFGSYAVPPTKEARTKPITPHPGSLLAGCAATFCVRRETVVGADEGRWRP